MFLTQEGGIIVKPISILLGKFMNLLYELFLSMDITSIGLAILLFTIIVRLLFVPLMFKQNKSSKLMNYIQPEINKATKKYRGKTDQESMLAQQRITREIQSKYGVSMTSGCLTSLIQFPIFIAVYNVIRNIPAYVDKVRALYEPIASSILSDDKAFKILEAFQKDSSVKTLSTVTLENGNINTYIDVLAKVPSDQLADLSKSFSEGGFSEIAAMIANNSQAINDTYNFLGIIDLTAAPGFHFTIALIIPILSMIFQFMSMYATPQQTSSDPQQQATMKTMKTMMAVMPIMSFFVCISVPAGVGLYWAMGSLLSFLTSLGINLYFKHADMEKILEKSAKKAAKKNAKKKASGKKSFWEKMQDAAMGQVPEDSSKPRVNNKAATMSLKTLEADYNNSDATKPKVEYKKGSLAYRANAVQRYNDNNGGKN